MAEKGETDRSRQIWRKGGLVLGPVSRFGGCPTETCGGELRDLQSAFPEQGVPNVTEA